VGTETPEAYMDVKKRILPLPLALTLVALAAQPAAAQPTDTSGKKAFSKTRTEVRDTAKSPTTRGAGRKVH